MIISAFFAFFIEYQDKNALFYRHGIDKTQGE